MESLLHSPLYCHCPDTERLLFPHTGGPLPREQRLLIIGGKRVQQREEGSVRPAEAYEIGLVTRGHVCLRRARHHVVLLPDRAVAAEVLKNGREEFLRNPIGLGGES